MSETTIQPREAQNATTLPPKGLGNLQWRDLIKGLYYAIIGQVLFLIGFFFNSLFQETPHFPTWAEWLPYLKPIGITIGGYMAGKIGVNNVGQLWQKDKPIIHVPADEYAKTLEEMDALKKEVENLKTVKNV